MKHFMYFTETFNFRIDSTNCCSCPTVISRYKIDWRMIGDIFSVGYFFGFWRGLKL